MRKNVKKPLSIKIYCNVKHFLVICKCLEYSCVKLSLRDFFPYTMLLQFFHSFCLRSALVCSFFFAQTIIAFFDYGLFRIGIFSAKCLFQKFGLVSSLLPYVFQLISIPSNLRLVLNLSGLTQFGFGLLPQIFHRCRTLLFQVFYSILLIKITIPQS